MYSNNFMNCSKRWKENESHNSFSHRYLLIPVLSYSQNMGNCEMCGKGTELVVADIEGVELKVCAGCARFGTIRKRSDTSTVTLKTPQPESPSFKVIDHYSLLLRSAREQKGMTQEEFAKFLNEKESVVAHWEAGKAKPGIDAAQRAGKLLGIQFIERDETVAAKIESSKKADELTLGDFIKVRKRK